jgi:hypothetical protein
MGVRKHTRFRRRASGDALRGCLSRAIQVIEPDGIEKARDAVAQTVGIFELTLPDYENLPSKVP